MPTLAPSLQTHVPNSTTATGVDVPGSTTVVALQGQTSCACLWHARVRQWLPIVSILLSTYPHRAWRHNAFSLTSAVHDHFGHQIWCHDCFSLSPDGARPIHVAWSSGTIAFCGKVCRRHENLSCIVYINHKKKIVLNTIYNIGATTCYIDLQHWSNNNLQLWMCQVLKNFNYWNIFFELVSTMFCRQMRIQSQQQHAT